jgi:hypothetical protein
MAMARLAATNAASRASRASSRHRWGENATEWDNRRHWYSRRETRLRPSRRGRYQPRCFPGISIGSVRSCPSQPDPTTRSPVKEVGAQHCPNWNWRASRFAQGPARSIPIQEPGVFRDFSTDSIPSPACSRVSFLVPTKAKAIASRVGFAESSPMRRIRILRPRRPCLTHSAAAATSAESRAC